MDIMICLPQLFTVGSTRHLVAFTVMSPVPDPGRQTDRLTDRQTDNEAPNDKMDETMVERCPDQIGVNKETNEGTSKPSIHHADGPCHRGDTENAN